MNPGTRLALVLVALAAGCADDSSAADTDGGSSSGAGTSTGLAETSTADDGGSSSAGDSSSTGGGTTDTGTGAASSVGTTSADASTSAEGSSTTSDGSSTTGTVGPTCGDGIVDGDETCDGDALAGASCSDQGFVAGVLTCLPDCSGFDTSGCIVAGDCCGAHGAVGCADPSCQQTICGLDPFCCDTQWDGICANEALVDAACLDVGGACPCPDEVILGALGPAVASGDTTGDDDDIVVSCGGGNGNDRVIYFVSPEAGTYTFDTFGSGFDTKLAIWTDCAVEAACSDDAGGLAQSELTIELADGQGIRVIVDGYDGATGPWVLNATQVPDAPPVCGDGIVGAPEICDGASLNGQTCLIQGFPGGGPLGCAPDCLSFDTSACIDGPYACSDEDIGGLTGPAIVTGDTNTDDDDLGASCGGGDGNDHVVTFTAPAAGIYVFDTFGSAYDTKLALYADCTSELYCNDDTGGLQSQLAINMGAGQDVLVVIDGYDGSTGPFILNITPP